MTVDKLFNDISRRAESLDIATCRKFDPKLLVPEQRIRDLCNEDKCGNYGKHYMCPPHVGTLDEIREKLSGFQRGVLLQYSEPLDVRNDGEGLMRTKLDFHEKILQLEGMLNDEGVAPVWGMIGGSCELCQPCLAATGDPCPHLEKARMSLESVAVDVIALLDRFGLDSEFHRDRITWAGCILF
jgi:predicted metal-binding protein